MRWYDVAQWSDVKDMYNYAKGNSLNLLSDYPADFWKDYRDNHLEYDKMFTRMFRSYRYYMQDPYNKDDETIAEITEDFINAVYMWLKMNDKKYSELYKMNVLNMVEVSPIDDFYSLEIMDGTKSYDGTYTDGQRSDSNSTTYGSRTDVTTQQIEGFNSAEFDDSDKATTNYGQHIDSTSFNKGSQSNTDVHSEDNDYTLTKKGFNNNPYDNLSTFKEVWTDFDFYRYIFKDICAEFLLV